jgi:hypothetical protein
MQGILQTWGYTSGDYTLVEFSMYGSHFVFLDFSTVFSSDASSQIWYQNLAGISLRFNPQVKTN